MRSLCPGHLASYWLQNQSSPFPAQMVLCMVMLAVVLSGTEANLIDILKSTEVASNSQADSDCKLDLAAPGAAILEPSCTVGDNACVWKCFQTITLSVLPGNASISTSSATGCTCPSAAIIDPKVPERVS